MDFLKSVYYVPEPQQKDKIRTERIKEQKEKMDRKNYEKK